MLENFKVNDIILSKEQSLPIIENPNISMVIASAGSGKTLTIVGKIKYMLENGLVKSNEICAITYTNKAVDSLKKKIKEVTYEDIDVFTFHKLALNILDKNNYDYSIVNSNILDEIINEFFITRAFESKVLRNYIYNYFGIYIFKTNSNYQKLLNSKEMISLKNLVKTFISYMKANNLDYKWLFLLKNKRYKKLLLIIYAIYNIYISELKSSNSLDVDGMINLATNVVNEGKVNLEYKLIIIDEFQDTSLSRFNLISSIVNATKSNLCVVGDDYQSIYKFQGCDLSLFLDFKKYYNNAKIYYLNETYRNSMELVNIAGTFINKNSYQISKKIFSKKHLANPVIIEKYSNEKKVLVELIGKLPTDKEILLLGRNNFDIDKYLYDYELLDSKLIIPNDNHNLKYMTIHSSKGLESDIVIVLNVNNDTYGIPSKVKEEKLLDLIKKKDEYPFAEERRLFYVALTRTKSYVYLLTDKYNPSLFIKELKEILFIK